MDGDLPTFVKITVGKEGKCWRIPEGLLCDRIEYFKKAFQSGFKEGEDKEIEFPEEDPQAFVVLINRLFNGTSRPGWGIQSKEDQMQRCRLFLFAYMLMVPDLGTSAIEAFARLFESKSGRSLGVSKEAVELAYHNYTDDDRLRKAMVHAHVAYYLCDLDAWGRQNALEEWTETTSCDGAFHLDVMSTLRTHMASTDRYSPCWYPHRMLHLPNQEVPRATAGGWGTRCSTRRDWQDCGGEYRDSWVPGERMEIGNRRDIERTHYHLGRAAFGSCLHLGF